MWDERLNSAKNRPRFARYARGQFRKTFVPQALAHLSRFH
jgi:hypothetical protein